MPENQTPQRAPHATLPSALALEDILVILEAYHDRQQEKLHEIRTGFSQLRTDGIKQTALRMEALTPNRTEYLKLLTQHIMAVLDGGDGPILSSFS